MERERKVKSIKFIIALYDAFCELKILLVL